MLYVVGPRGKDLTGSQASGAGPVYTDRTKFLSHQKFAWKWLGNVSRMQP